MPVVIFMFFMAASLVVLLRREQAKPDSRPRTGDVSARLLRWIGGMLPANRADWGVGMLGELEHIEDRVERRRFVIGCLAGIVLLPWGWVGAPMAALVAVSLGGVTVFSVSFAHFGLGGAAFNWVMLGILIALLASFVLAVGVWLRTPGVAGPGLIGGVVAAVTWIGLSGFSFGELLAPISMRRFLAMSIVTSLVVGVAGTWRSRSSLDGSRAARLAGVVGGLVTFLVSTMAVFALSGGPRDPGSSVSQGVSEALFGATLHSLILLPLATALMGAATATITARLRSV